LFRGYWDAVNSVSRGQSFTDDIYLHVNSGYVPPPPIGNWVTSAFAYTLGQCYNATVSSVTNNYICIASHTGCGNFSQDLAGVYTNTVTFTEDGSNNLQVNWSGMTPNYPQNGAKVYFTGGTLPTGLTAGLPYEYYIVNASGTTTGTANLSSTYAGSPITWTNNGSGTITLNLVSNPKWAILPNYLTQLYNGALQNGWLNAITPIMPIYSDMEQWALWAYQNTGITQKTTNTQQGCWLSATFYKMPYTVTASGSATLSAGAATINTDVLTNQSFVRLMKTTWATNTPSSGNGAYLVANADEFQIGVGGSFYVASTNATDTDTFTWQVCEPIQ
jgi:hypothetical protein